jgi:hypothetical protein
MIRLQGEIESGTCDDDDPAIWVVQRGGKPNTKYFCIRDPFWTDEDDALYRTRSEAQSEIYSYLEFERSAGWDDMADEELERWCQVLDWLRQGYESWYDLPDVLTGGSTVTRKGTVGSEPAKRRRTAASRKKRKTKAGGNVQ